MLLAEAKSYIGRVCTVRFLDRSGQEQSISSKVHDATYVPMYGGYIVTDMDDIRLDRIVTVVIEGQKTETTVSRCERVAA